jgi:hypothetical protein
MVKFAGANDCKGETVIETGPFALREVANERSNAAATIGSLMPL